MDVRIIILFTEIFNCFGYEDLSYDKPTSHYPTYCYDHYNCHLYQSSNAVDRNKSTCTRTRRIGRHSPYQTTWWRVDLGDVYNVYNVIIFFKEYGEINVLRQRGRFAGFSIYLSNSTTKETGILCYKNNQELPPLEFTTACIGQGRYLIFYNERLSNMSYPDGYETYSYTELCEVIVQGCTRTGFYGEQCKLPCPENCLERKCNIKNGACTDCKKGWSGKLCKERCPYGTYGLNCRNMCAGYCKDNTSCNHVTGGCDNGCVAGWSGLFCEKECGIGKYGSGCVHNCSGHCQDDTPCDRENGHCETDCIPGYMGDICDQKCPPGSYGINCRHTCSGQCINQEICNRYDGSCSRGCQEPYIGLACDFYHDTSTSASTIALAVLVSLIATLLISVFTLLMRQKYYKNHKKINDPGEDATVNAAFTISPAGIINESRTSEESSVTEEPQNYEEVKVSENPNPYQVLHSPELRNAYQNLEFAA